MEERYTIHKLKTWPVFFEAIMNGIKTFEVRYNDRRFKVGDRLDLFEFDPDAMENGEYTGRHCHRFISYILDTNPFIDLKGYIILGLQPEPIKEITDQDIWQEAQSAKVHGWTSDQYRLYQEGFFDGAKWRDGKITGTGKSNKDAI